MRYIVYTFPSSLEYRFLYHVRLFVWVVGAQGWRRYVWPTFLARRLLFFGLDAGTDANPAAFAIAKQATFAEMLGDLWCSIRRRPWPKRGTIWLFLERTPTNGPDGMTTATMAIEDDHLEAEYDAIREHLMPWWLASDTFGAFEEETYRRQYKRGRPSETTTEVAILAQRVAEIREQSDGQRLSRKKIAAILEERYGTPGITKEQIRYAEERARRDEPPEDLDE